MNTGTETAAPRSLLVLPGGAYTSLAEHECEPVAEWARALGWRSEVVRYPVGPAAPMALAHVRAAVAAERDAGVRTVGVIGFSAGGHLAGMTALSPAKTAQERVDFAILSYPVVTMEERAHTRSLQQLLGADPSPEERIAASLDRLVTETSPPLFLWHTADDPVVPVADHTLPLAAALARAHRPHELHVFPGDIHGVGLARDGSAQAWTRLCAEWLGRQFG